MGNTGCGVAPARPAERETVLATLAHVEGMNMETLRAGVAWEFESYPEYLDALDRRPKRINVASFLPHSMVRLYAMGAEAATTRAAEPAEVAAMCAIAREAFEAGSIGISTSQAPTQMGAFGRPVPSRLADAAEIRALVAAMAHYDGRIAEITYGPVFEIDEVAALSKETGVRITWGSLLTGLFGGPGAAMALLERASAVGGDIWPQVSCREIVFQMSLTNPYYFNLVPAFSEVIGQHGADLRDRFADPAWRDRARPDVLKARPGAYDRISIGESELHRDLRGPSIAQLAEKEGRHPFDLMLDLALEEDLATRFRIVSRNEDPVELADLLRDHRTVLGAHDAGAHVDMLCDANFPTHLLAHWWRETGVLRLEEAVWRMTGQAAEVFGIPERGRVAPGYVADLVAFDPAAVSTEPLERRFDFPGGTDRLVADSHGVAHVWVAGRAVRRDYRPVEGAYPGQLLRI
jgi:N-acyl-D-aspartate/D-glutamate deacylase